MSKKPSKQHGAHPAHPRCPKCDKAMCKAMPQMDAQGNWLRDEQGRLKPTSVKKSDPWAYCRNRECPLYGQDQTKGVEAPEAAGAEALVKKRATAKASKAPEAPPKRVEPEEVTRARENIRAVLGTNGPHSKAAIGLTLAIMAQEMGSHEMANKLIEEFKLDKQFGFEKQEPKA